MYRILFISLFLSLFTTSLSAGEVKTGNVIFIHPDGSGGSMWNALRMYEYGPDSLSNWDRLERIALYKPHLLNSTNASSHGGATVHAYGTKVLFDTYGNSEEKPVRSLSQTDKSIMMEAVEAGMATALINSGHICEPGTGVFVASSSERSNTDYISEQIINSGVDLILSGGEIFLLPEDEVGYFGQKGKRKDDRNLVTEAIAHGYTVVYTRDELFALDDTVNKVLGLFAPYHTFHAKPEEYLAEEGVPLYKETAPTVSEMADKALAILETKQKQIFMVIEEEGTDNFGNSNNASGTLEALRHADAAIGISLEFLKTHPNTLVITAADSDAGGFEMLAVRKNFEKPLEIVGSNGAPLDGINGKGSLPFQTKPDRNGQRLYFGVGWATNHDVAGSVLARASGINAEMLTAIIDNTDVYRIMYKTLFGIRLPRYIESN